MGNYNIIEISSAESNRFQSFNSDDELLYVDHLQGLKNEIDSFVELENNWDGYGGVPVLQAIADKAKQFVSLLNDTFIDFITDIFPNPHGTITIEWENSSQEKLSLEIGKDNYSYFIEIGNNPKFFNGQNIPSLEVFSSHLGEIYKNELPKFIFR